MTTSSFAPEQGERCGAPRTPNSKVLCEMDHGHKPEFSELLDREVLNHRGRDAAGRWHSWVQTD